MRAHSERGYSKQFKIHLKVSRNARRHSLMDMCVHSIDHDPMINAAAHAITIHQIDKLLFCNCETIIFS